MFNLVFQALLIDTGAYNYTATSEQMEHWQERTGIPFDPLTYKDEVKDVMINCPSCKDSVSVAWENDGHGYAENDFLCACAQCELSTSRDRLCVAKFIKDLSDIYLSENMTIRWVHHMYLLFSDLFHYFVISAELY